MPVLLVGCAISSVQADSWTNTDSLNIARYNHAVTLLPNGMVLVAGGYNGNYLASSELYDPVSGTWTNTGSLNNGRAEHTATLLPNGKVLVAGGLGGGGSLNFLSSCELYDPTSGTWTNTGSLNKGRINHTAALLSNGKVLVAAGENSSGLTYYITNSCELYDPASGTWTNTGSLNTARVGHTATLLPNGKVLVAGGSDISINYRASAELYDPISGTWTNTGSLNTARANHTATLLPNGKVLVAGGNNINRLSSSEIYDPATGTWTNTGSLNIARYFHTATLLPDSKVLVAGGSGGSSGINAFLVSSEVYDPANGAWTTTDSLNTAREYHTATLLNNGVVLVTGGYNSGLSLASTELYVVSSAPLCIGFSSNLVTVWWPNAPGWVLQQNSDLSNPNGWSASSGVTNSNGTNYLNLANPSDNLFFRLH